MVLFVLAEMLKVMGHSVSVFERPEDAFGYMQQHGENIDLVITDYHMPGMNGLDLLSKLRKLGCNLPAMILTAYSAEVDERWAEQCNARVIDKPVKIDVLRNYIQSCQQAGSQ